MKTVHISDVSNIRMVAGGEKRHPIVIIDGIVKEWVGIGWIGDLPPTPEEAEKYPTVVRETRKEQRKVARQRKAANDKIVRRHGR